MNVDPAAISDAVALCARVAARTQAQAPAGLCGNSFLPSAPTAPPLVVREYFDFSSLIPTQSAAPAPPPTRVATCWIPEPGPSFPFFELGTLAIGLLFLVALWFFVYEFFGVYPEARGETPWPPGRHSDERTVHMNGDEGR